MLATGGPFTTIGDGLFSLGRSLLSQLDPERAHHLALASLERLAPLLPTPVAPIAHPLERIGLRFPNRLGLAAGLDKNGVAIDAWAAMGFGHVEVGTVTPRPQPGNPKPRLFRLPDHRAIINRMGFNNDGVSALVERLKTSRFLKGGGIVGVNIGKNATTPLAEAADDYLCCLREVYAVASYVTVNISSPNTADLRQLQHDVALDALLSQLKAEQATLSDRHGRYTPLLLKIAPDLTDAEIAVIAATVRRQRIDGLIATNTTIDRSAVAGERHAGEAGGLSGAPLYERSTSVLSALSTALAGEVLLIGVGGIDDVASAHGKWAAGAELLQLYSGLIYHGPGLIKRLLAANPAAKHDQPEDATR